MKFIPHDYQQYAIQFLTEHPVAALLLDMGLGKTVTTLTAINELLFDPLFINPPAFRNCVHVIGQSQRDNISFNTVDYRRRLFT